MSSCCNKSLQAELRNLVARATTLDEWLARSSGAQSPNQEVLSSLYIDRWSERAAQGNLLKFGERLRWEGYDESSVRAALVNSPSPDEDLPQWAHTIGDILEGLPFELDPALGWTDAESQLPFEDVFLPIVGYAIRRLRVGARHDIAIRGIARGLLRRLTAVASETLETVFSERRTCGHRLLARLVDQLALKTGRTLYDAFVSDVHARGMRDLFERFPVLARLIGTLIDLWVDEANEFLERLEADKADLNAAFNGGFPLGPLADLEDGLSDSHSGGRTVRILTFSPDVKIVYKPRNLGLETAWAQFLSWMNSKNVQPSLWTPRIVNRESYGWVEFVGAGPECDEAAVRRFYLRAGMLVCLTYILQGSDFHRENVLACGEHPVLIDVETILIPELRLGAEMDRLVTAHRQMIRSVLTSGLLPHWERTDHGGSYDISGLGSVTCDETFGEQLVWKHLNTDEMHRVERKVAVPALRNTPLVDGTLVRGEDYVHEITAGFEMAYRVILEHRKELLSEESPLKVFRGCNVRVIYRDTALYAILLDAAVADEALATGLQHSLQFELLARTFLPRHSGEDNWRIFKAEVQSMEQRDIPYFTVAADSVDFFPDGIHRIQGFFRRSGLDATRLAIEQLSDADLSRQLRFIQASFFAKCARPDAYESKVAAPSKIAPVCDGKSPLDCAIEIGRDIVSQAVGDRFLAATWFDLQFLPDCARYQLQLLSPGLYGGVGGIALFLAALYSVTGDESYKNVALAALATSRAGLMSEGVDPDWANVCAGEMGIGIAEGIPSLIYAHVVVGRLLNDYDLIHCALTLSNFVSEQAIRSDGALDVLSGCAGAALGLLALSEQTANQGVLEKAAACGDRLVSTQLDGDADAGGWMNPCGRPLTGFAHGAAGNLYALLRLHAATGNCKYRVAAEAALDFEKRRFSPEHSNWPDDRTEQRRWGLGWCTGAPGVGLSRVGARRLLDNSTLAQEIDVTIDSIRRHQRPIVDHLCCGMGSHIELLLASGCINKAVQIATEWAGEALGNGGFRLFPQLPLWVKSYGFFQGLSGIGYQLLRAVAPDCIPSVLLFE